MKRLFLLLFAMGVVILSPANAKVYYVGLSGMSDNSSNLPATVAQATANLGIDTIYIGIGLYKLNDELFINDVVMGGCSVSGGKVIRQYPGAVGNQRAKMTVLDGNSLMLSLPSQKHRVATINAGGVIDGCLIRNGHARGTTNNPNDTKGFGGGVLINTGGKLHNSIVRGNVAMNLQFSKTNPSYGGGVYVNGGDVANCIIAFNMDDMGLGIGGSSGTILNNTIARNANAPRYVLIPGNRGGTPFRHYRHHTTLSITLTEPYIILDSFYMAATETTQGQYSCFLAAIDLVQKGADAVNGNPLLTFVNSQSEWDSIGAANTPMSGYTDIPISKYLGFVSSPNYILLGVHDVIHTSYRARLFIGINGTAGSGSEVYYPKKAIHFPSGLGYSAGTSGSVSYSADPGISENFPASYISWFGSVAFSVWLGGMLPTEAQWEYAARSTATGIQTAIAYAGGYTNPHDVGWNHINTKEASAHEVATLLPTELGLYDMNGNSQEWVCDCYFSLNSTAYPTGNSVSATAAATASAFTVSEQAGSNGSSPEKPLYNPIYNFGSAARVARGGHWASTATYYFPLGNRTINASWISTSGYFGFRSVACAGL